VTSGTGIILEAKFFFLKSSLRKIWWGVIGFKTLNPYKGILPRLTLKQEPPGSVHLQQKHGNILHIIGFWKEYPIVSALLTQFRTIALDFLGLTSCIFSITIDNGKKIRENGLYSRIKSV